MMALFPAWVPTEAILLGVLVFLGVVLFMNRNRMRMVNVVFEREAFVVGIGVVIAAANQHLAESVGAIGGTGWIALGAVVSGGGLAFWAMD